jgi:methane monooxygenase component C
MAEHCDMTEHRVRMTFEGGDPIEIVCREDEDVISAGLRQSVLLVSDCRQGICGACRGFLEEGRYDSLLEHSPHALSDHDEEAGWVLACRLKPRGDLCLDFDYAADRVGRLDAARRPGRIVALDRLSSSVVRIVVRTLSAQEPLRWEAGQHVRLQLADSGVTRAYSIANLAGGGHELEFFIRLIPGGAFSEAIESMRSDGATVAVEGPFGAFTWRAERPDPVFVAGGTGLSPILSMLRKLAVEAPHRRATLIFGVSTEDKLFGQAQIDSIVAACPGLKARVTVAEPTDSWTGLRGTAVDALARELAQAADPKGCDYYIGGPAPMVEAAQAVLEEFDIPRGAIHQELHVASGGLS